MSRLFFGALLALWLVVGSAAEEAVEPEMARVVSMIGQPEYCLAPVRIQLIDGSPVVPREDGFELEPGDHSLNGRAMLDTTYCRLLYDGISGPVPDLVASFDAGRTYYIALDHHAQNANDWRLVIWKVEPGEADVSGLDDHGSGPDTSDQGLQP